MTDRLAIKWLLIAVILGFAAWLLVTQPLRLGIDLRGGTSMTYEMSRASLAKIAPPDRGRALQETLATISKRIGGLGVKELQVRQVGDNQIEIEAPRMSDADLAAIRVQMLALGNLELLISLEDLGTGEKLDVPSDRPDVLDRFSWDRAAAETQRREAFERGRTILGDPYRDGEGYDLVEVKDGHARRLPITWLPQRAGDDADGKAMRAELARARDGQKVRHELIRGSWLFRDRRWFGATKPGFTGKDLSAIRRSQDKLGQRTVTLYLDRRRQTEFADYTGSYINRSLAVCVNDEVWHTLVITQAATETIAVEPKAGFTPEDQSWLVNCLQSGSLGLRPRLTQEADIGPALGEAAVRSATIAAAICFALTIAFLAWYYRVHGIVAGLALILNLGLILAATALFDITLTLPGIAGIMLATGLAVDATILLFERVRDEFEKGNAPLAALEAGYQRALLSIVDSNATTALTAALLLQFGAGPIRGFGATLLAGLVVSMFTVLVVTRAIFDLMVRFGRTPEIKFARLVRPVRYPFMAKARPWQIASAALVLVAIAAFALGGTRKYGVDFTGGTHLRLRLAAATTVDDVNRTIDGIRDGSGRHKYEEHEVVALPAPAGTSPAGPTEFAIKLRAGDEPTPTQVRVAVEERLRRIFPAAADPITAFSDLPTGEWRVEFRLPSAVDVAVARSSLTEFTEQDGSRPFNGAALDALDPVNDGKSTVARAFGFEVGRQDFCPGSAVADLRTAFGARLAATRPFENVTYAGPNVVASLKESALVSVIFALAAIILYVWLRFRDVRYGIAGVVALAHDVAVPLGLGIIAHRLGLVDAPLNQESLAAFLAIIGFSINDTVVIFDRVRENRRAIKGTYAEIMDVSIGQTMPRTILTSVTVSGVTLVLLVVSLVTGSPLQGFAFTMFLGTICGTYSTIFIACPLAAWMHRRQTAPPPARADTGGATRRKKAATA